MIRRRLAVGDVDSEERAVIDLRLKAIMAHAKYAGVYVDRKQIDRRTIDLSVVSADVLNSHLASALETLEPGVRREIEARVTAAANKSRKSRSKSLSKSLPVDITPDSDIQ